jgi:hypothetical protein
MRDFEDIVGTQGFFHVSFLISRPVSVPLRTSLSVGASIEAKATHHSKRVTDIELNVTTTFTCKHN